MGDHKPKRIILSVSSITDEQQERNTVMDIKTREELALYKETKIAEFETKMAEKLAELAILEAEWEANHQEETSRDNGTSTAQDDGQEEG